MPDQAVRAVRVARVVRGVGGALVGVLLVAGCAAGAAERAAGAPGPGWSAVPGQVAAETASPTAAVPHGDPVELSIPSIGVRSRLERLALGPQGELTPPTNPAEAGWFAGGVRPGDPGPAVIAGHVDSRTGPAVFTRLRELKPGAVVVVTDARGGVVRFVVSAVRSYPKSAFPTSEVYGATPDPQLRLITCGGDFDQQAHHYVDNLVAYADPTDNR